MKVLHIWNTSGVPSLIAKSLRRNGIESDVITRKSHDPFGFTKHYNDILLDLPGRTFLDRAVEMAKDYDIIHIHALVNLPKRMREVYPNKIIIIQHHGTEITTNDFSDVKECYQYCDQVITSTKDLFHILNGHKVENTLLDNAVDTDLFKPIKRRKNDDALLFNTTNMDMNSTHEFIRHYSDWTFNEIHRQSEGANYGGMSELLNEYSKYVDVKIGNWMNGKPIQALSKTGLEALACGLDVLDYKGDIVRGLPIEHTPEYQVKKLIELYSK